MTKHDHRFRKTLLDLLEQQIGTQSAKSFSNPRSEDFREGYTYGLRQIRATIGAMEINNDGYFPITSVHRVDLEEAGFDVSHISDETMADIADMMAGAYCESGGFWDGLNAAAEESGVPRKPGDDEADGAQSPSDNPNQQ